ncbi:MAG: tetratricopeptide repeat protein [Acidobacteria bacterium]|nr:MAG: tetratricopeptide repeat protein [Acidobacteriota bacterium]
MSRQRIGIALRSGVARLGGGALVVAASCGGTRIGPPRSGGPPTVLLVTIDTLRADRVGCYGRADAGTPMLDELAARGVRFAAAHTTAPLTLPAHSSIMTGRSVPAHGVRNNGTFALPPEIPTLAERFEAAGYATGAFISSPVLKRRHGLARGFQRYDDAIAEIPANVGRIVVHYAERSGRETVSRAIAWLLDQEGRPAFLWVHLWEPHSPYRPPPPFAERFRDDRYQGEVAAADAALKRLIDGIASLGRADGLLVVVSGDHGEALGDHGEQTHGLFLYEEVLRVPLIVSGPSWGVRHAVIEELASVADIAPTLAELARLPALPGTDGLSLAAALAGGPMPKRGGVFAESWLPRFDFGWSGLQAYLSGHRKLIRAPRPELYDLEADPEEMHDLAGERPGEVRELTSQLLAEVSRAAAASRGRAQVGATEKELETLRTLGYAGTGRVVEADDAVDPNRADPKDRVEVVHKHDRALFLLADGKPLEARTLLEEALEIEPDDPALLFQYAQTFIVAKDLPGAERVLRRAVRVHPDYGLAWYRLGQVLAQLGKDEEERAAYEKAIEHDPYNVAPRLALAESLIEAGQIEKARQVVEAARKLAPEDEQIEALMARMDAARSR